MQLTFILTKEFFLGLRQGETARSRKTRKAAGASSVKPSRVQSGGDRRLFRLIELQGRSVRARATSRRREVGHLGRSVNGSIHVIGRNRAPFYG
jgi:hypothetical protein